MPSQTDPVKALPEVKVKLFRSWHNGAGDADEIHFNHRMEEYASVESVTTRYNRVHGSVDARRPGQIRMGMYAKRMAQTNHDLTPVFAAEWADTNNIYPLVYYLVGRKIMKIEFGAVTEIGTNSLAANATGGMLDDDGSGIPYLYACFGGLSTSNKIQRMNLAQTVTTSADVVAAQLLSLNGKAYRTIAASNDKATCQVSVCPYGSDRFTLANWGAGTTVGFAGTNINTLTACRQAPVCIKPEGIFAYNQGLDQWINYTPSWLGFRHLNNGLGAFFLGDLLVVPMGDGGAVIFDGNNVRPFDPAPLDATPNLHTTKANFSSMAALRHWIAGATKTNSKRTSLGNSLLFMTTTDDISYTDSSADVRDLNLTTGPTLSTSASLKVYIGWTRPFCGIRFETGAANTNARTITVAVGTTAGSPGTYTTQGVVDFTSLAGATLGQSGDIIFTTDPVDTTNWVRTTVNGTTAYWARLTFSGALTATSWLNCQILPWHPSVDITNFPLDGIDKSGALPHVWMGRGDQLNGNTIWHDFVSLSRPDDIGQILFADVGGSGINKNRHMIAIGRFNVWEILTADDDKSGTEEAPVLNDVGLIEAASMVPQEGALVRLKELKISGHDFDPAWKLLFYYTWDAGKKWHKANTELRVPALQSFNDKDNKGNRFRWAIGWKGSAGEALSQACITEIEATFEVLDIPFDSTQERAVQNTPPRF